jgi:peroxiredoxin
MTVQRKQRIVAAVSGLAALATAALMFTGCASRSDVAESRGDYLSADGTVSQTAIDNRDTVIEFSGTGEDGETIKSSDYLGNVLVVNFWYASCPPCRREAPWLQELSEQYKPDGVQFLGVNVRDEPATAAAFSEKFEITYPSIIDESGEVTLAFAGIAPPSAVPTTIVLDAEGRVAARILGIIDKALLDGLIAATLAESSP